MVFPVSMLEDIATGKLPVQDNASTRAIYHMLYEQLTARQDSD